MRIRTHTQLITLLVVGSLGAGCRQPDSTAGATAAGAPSSAVPRAVAAGPLEGHFSQLTMLTDGGENAEPYFSFDGAWRDERVRHLLEGLSGRRANPSTAAPSRERGRGRGA